MTNDLHALGEREGLGKTLGIEFVEATPQRVVATMLITPHIHQPFGFLHGGASVALAETITLTLNCQYPTCAHGAKAR